MTKPEKTPEKENGHQQAKEQPKEDKPLVDHNVVVIPINSHLLINELITLFFQTPDYFNVKEGETDNDAEVLRRNVNSNVKFSDSKPQLKLKKTPVMGKMESKKTPEGPKNGGKKTPEALKGCHKGHCHGKNKKPRSKDKPRSRKRSKTSNKSKQARNGEVDGQSSTAPQVIMNIENMTIITSSASRDSGVSAQPEGKNAPVGALTTPVESVVKEGGKKDNKPRVQ